MKLCTNRTRNHRIILLYALPFCHLNPTPTSLLHSTPRLQYETVYFYVLCMHSIFFILSHTSSLTFSSPALLINFGWCLLFVRVRTITSSNICSFSCAISSNRRWCLRARFRATFPTLLMFCYIALLVSSTCVSVRSLQ